LILAERAVETDGRNIEHTSEDQRLPKQGNISR
jgi:hypothetical protein